MPDPTVLKEFKADQHAAWVRGNSLGTDPSTQLTCELNQLTPNMPCNTNPTDNGWCYVENNGTTKGCAQEILFSATALKAGVTTSLQCLEASTSVVGGDAAAAAAPAAPAAEAGAAGH